MTSHHPDLTKIDITVADLTVVQLNVVITQSSHSHHIVNLCESCDLNVILCDLNVILCDWLALTVGISHSYNSITLLQYVSHV